MNELLRTQAAAGSITPQLEGASQSESHPKRATVKNNSNPEKGGKKHE